jgi:hypothetical protein
MPTLLLNFIVFTERNRIDMKSHIITSLAWLLIGTITIASCKKKEDPKLPAEVHINFKNYAGAEPLKLNTATYTTPQGEQITVSRFNYYISNIKLTKSDGSVYAEPESYHLLQQEKTGSLHFHLKDVPAGTYTGMSFMIGVDEPRNIDGAQTGALDPINGMFWTWQTGYIMAKLEGKSPQSKDTTNKYVLHVGGFSGEYNGIRSISLNFPSAIAIEGSKSGDVVIKADMLKWFEPNAVKISENSELMMPSAATRKIADNYSKMFTLESAGVTTE